MMNQLTVFMTQQQEQFQREQEQEQTTTTISCENCKKIMDKKGYFYIIENKIHFFHDTLCKFKYTKKQERQKQKILKVESRLKSCLKCGKLFDPARKERKYCSRSCSRNNQSALYDRFNWCPLCKWVPKDKAILKQKYKYLKDKYYCHICNSPLVTKQPRKNK